MILAPMLHTASPWLTVLLLGTLAFSWVLALVLWLAFDRQDGWM